MRNDLRYSNTNSIFFHRFRSDSYEIVDQSICERKTLLKDIIPLNVSQTVIADHILFQYNFNITTILLKIISITKIGNK